MLCYHGVIPDDHPVDPYRTRVAVNVSDFRRQMATVCRWFKPVSAIDVLDHVENGKLLPQHAILITFDDGFRNNLTCRCPGT